MVAVWCCKASCFAIITEVIIRQTPKLLIGIDEVGRGPLAGPVAVCALIWKNRQLDPPDHMKDSKKLSPQKRNEWFVRIEEWREQGTLDYAVSYIEAEAIDTIGISNAIKCALMESLARLRVEPETVHILLDGGLAAPDEYMHQETIIKGDEKEPIIALASIAAKVLRDQLMDEMSDVHPGYGFENHKGYGTVEHYKAIKKYGITPLHRKSFLTKMS
jgi:ribonuclease HII